MGRDQPDYEGGSAEFLNTPAEASAWHEGIYDALKVIVKGAKKGAWTGTKVWNPGKMIMALNVVEHGFESWEEKENQYHDIAALLTFLLWYAIVVLGLYARSHGII